MRVHGAVPAATALYDAAIKRFAAAGAALVDVEAPADSGQLDDLELTVLLTEFKADLSNYLKASPAFLPVRTLARRHRLQSPALCGGNVAIRPGLLERAQATTGLRDPRYLGRKALEASRRIAGVEGLAKMLASQQLKVLIAPTMGPAFLIDPINGDTINSPGPGNLPAIAGYPHLTLPLGLVKGLPVGVSVIGPAWTDATVLEIGAAFERMLGKVPSPRFIPDSAGMHVRPRSNQPPGA